MASCIGDTLTNNGGIVALGILEAMERRNDAFPP